MTTIFYSIETTTENFKIIIKTMIINKGGGALEIKMNNKWNNNHSFSTSSIACEFSFEINILLMGLQFQLLPVSLTVKITFLNNHTYLNETTLLSWGIRLNRNGLSVH